MINYTRWCTCHPSDAPRICAHKYATSECIESGRKWDNHFLGLALAHAKMSKDPSTQVGAVIVGHERELISAGFNGFPRGINDSPERLNDRDMKLRIVVHAEMNAILAAAKLGISLKGASLYLAATKPNGEEWWGGPPCTRCTVELIQSGIVEVVSRPYNKKTSDKWHNDLLFAADLLKEAGIIYREVEIT